MSSRNLAILVGHVGNDPEFKDLQTSSVANFSLATNEKYNDKATGNPVTKTEWHNIVVWGSRAEFVSKYVKKGDPLYVEGKIQTRSFETEAGDTKYITEINARSVQKLGSKREE